MSIKANESHVTIGEEAPINMQPDRLESGNHVSVHSDSREFVERVNEEEELHGGCGEDYEVDESQSDIDDSNLFIGDIEGSCSEDDLRSVFEPYGEIVEILLKKSKMDAQSLRYGFVRMADKEAAECAMKKLDGTELNGRIIRVNWARRNSRLHIGNIDSVITEEQLAAAFRPYGDLIEDDTIIHRTGRGGNFGQIHFKSRQDAQVAKAAMAGITLGSKALHVEWNQISAKSTYSSNKFNLKPNGGSFETGPVLSIYVQFESVQGEDVNVDDSVLREIFKQFGEVTAVAIKNFIVDPMSGQQRGYAFVHYPSSQVGRDSAYAAVLSCTDIVIKGIHLSVEFSKNFRRGVSSFSSENGHDATDGFDPEGLNPDSYRRRNRFSPYSMQGRGFNGREKPRNRHYSPNYNDANGNQPYSSIYRDNANGISQYCGAISSQEASQELYQEYSWPSGYVNYYGEGYPPVDSLQSNENISNNSPLQIQMQTQTPTMAYQSPVAGTQQTVVSHVYPYTDGVPNASNVEAAQLHGPNMQYYPYYEGWSNYPEMFTSIIPGVSSAHQAHQSNLQLLQHQQLLHSGMYGYTSPVQMNMGARFPGGVMGSPFYGHQTFQTTYPTPSVPKKSSYYVHSPGGSAGNASTMFPTQQGQDDAHAVSSRIIHQTTHQPNVHKHANNGNSLGNNVAVPRYPNPPLSPMNKFGNGNSKSSTTGFKEKLEQSSDVIDHTESNEAGGNHGHTKSTASLSNAKLTHSHANNSSPDAMSSVPVNVSANS